MKVLVFSDTHLTHVFDEKKYAFLKKIISAADQVIINGDFWDGYLTTFEQFINSPWKDLFPLLKEKKTVYIYGNHDRSLFSDSRVSLFSIIQAQKYTFKNNEQVFLLQHGNLVLPSIDDIFRCPRAFLKIPTSFFSFIERSFATIFRKPFRFWGSSLNNALKQEAKNTIGFSIFGHTHMAQFDANHAFAVTGFIQFGIGQYLTIENGKVTPHHEWYL